MQKLLHSQVLNSNLLNDTSNILGNVVESAMVWPPLVSETGISVAVFSYAGKIRVSVKVDTAVISDPMVLMDNFTKEVEDLVAMTTDDEASS